jgi:hypothetical protein
MKKICFLLFVFVLFAPKLYAFSPYLINAEGGDYAVIDSSRDVVVSTGNLKADLLAANTNYPELSKINVLAGWYADVAHDRAMFNWGESGNEYDGMQIYSGKLILSLSGRNLLASIKKEDKKWGPYHEAGYDNKIYFTGWRNDGTPNTIAYDGHLKLITADGPPLKFGILNKYTCFIPGTTQIYDGFNAKEGVYDVENNKFIAPTPMAFKEYSQIECKNGVVLSYIPNPERDERKPGGIVFQAYDLKASKILSKIAPSDIKGNPLKEWSLTPDGAFAVWSGHADVGVVGGTGSFETGRFAFFSTATGKKTGELKLEEKEWEDYQFGTSTWVNGFSLDGKKLLVCSGPYLYVIDIEAAKVLHKVEIPFTPGNNGEGFIVWP